MRFTPAVLAMLLFLGACSGRTGSVPSGHPSDAGSGGDPAAGGSGGGGAGGTSVPGPREVDCTDGRDDDDDGAVDCDDPDCTADDPLAANVAEDLVAYARGSGERAVIVYAATGLPGSKQRLRALPVDGAAVAGPAPVVYEGPPAFLALSARGEDGFALVVGHRTSELLELVLLDRDGEPQETHVLETGDLRRPLIAAAIDPASGALAVLRSVDDLRMEFAWFAPSGELLADWKPYAILEHRVGRMAVSGGRTWILRVANFDDDVIDGQMIAIEPAGFDARALPPMRAHTEPVVAGPGLVFHGQGAQKVPGGTVRGPELVHVGLDGAVIRRVEVAQPEGSLRLASFVGGWPGGVGVVYPGYEGGAEELLVVRASADLAQVDPVAPLLPGLPTVFHLETTADEDRVFYLSEDRRELRVKVTPIACRP